MSDLLQQRWEIEGPRRQACNEVHVYAYVQGRMIGMIDGELRENHVAIIMAYVSPPWRGSQVLHDMLAALKLQHRPILVPRRRRGAA